MELLFEKSMEGRRSHYLPPCDTPETELPQELCRSGAPRLPQLSEPDVSRHYSALERRCFGVDDGFYPLGSCTMKYNPRLHEDLVTLPGFTDIHPLQPETTVQGCMEVLAQAEQLLCQITGMDAMTFQPAAGAHGELTGVMLIRKYHEERGDKARNKILVPDSAHGTNPATVAMCGMTVVNIPSGPDGCVNLDRLWEAAGKDTAGLMLTNPNTLGIFEKDILEITRIVHDAGGLVYYDGANLNAIMGMIRPGDMGFDCVHLNLHKTFATPHGGGGPGSGAVGCTEKLAPYLPGPRLEKTAEGLRWQKDDPRSIGRVKQFYGNFLVVVKALGYLITLGREGIPQAARDAVLNANYLMKRLEECFATAYPGQCMHEFVVTLEREAKEHGFGAMDMAKAMLDRGMHPPTMYFPLIVPEVLMIEPTETEGKETLDRAADVMCDLYRQVVEDPSIAKQAPRTTPVRRPDEVMAARKPVLRYQPPV